MKDIILSVICSLSIGFVIAFLAFQYFESNSPKVYLVNDFSEVGEGAFGLNEIRIGNGLYKAINKCHEARGVTSIQGSTFDAEITCITDGGTYTYRNWTWRGYTELPALNK